jgi:hypothetical protein
MTLLRAQERCHGIGDGACVVDGVTGSGRRRWRHIMGPRLWSGMMVWRLRGGLDNGVGCREVVDGVGSWEIFGGESLTRGPDHSSNGRMP